jgi:hypothetical protein
MFDLTVMDFTRWGMSGAQARFITPNEVPGMMLLREAHAFAKVVPGREQHANWFQGIDHPDARLIAAAPDLLEAAKAALVQAEGCFFNHYPGDDPATASQPEHIAMLHAAISKAEGLDEVGEQGTAKR